MLLKQLNLGNFRNLESLTLNPIDGFNVLWGDNGQGKTNILEAIYYLGHLKSFRSTTSGNLIQAGSSRAHLNGKIFAKGSNHRLEVVLTSTQRRMRVDARDVSGAGEFLGKIKTILFAPEEVNLVKGGPAGRRALMDRGIFLTSALFLPHAQEYYRYLRQRNRSLREGRKNVDLEPWTEGLVRSGVRLRLARRQYLNRLNPLLEETYREISRGRGKAAVEYPAGNGTATEIEKTFRGDLERTRERERRLGQTLTGPHRDDFKFMVNGDDLRFFGSQGQQRSFMISLKVGQARDLEGLTGEIPILLLDDFTSELDRNRREFLLRFLATGAGQVFITTTDLQDLNGLKLDSEQVFCLRQGRLC